MLSKFWGSVLLVAQWQIVYRTFTIPDFFCLCHACEGDWRGLQEIPQLIIVNEILLQPTSRRFLRELDEAPRENNLQYIY